MNPHMTSDGSDHGGGCPFSGQRTDAAVLPPRPARRPDPRPTAGLALARKVVAGIRRTGKHFLPVPVLEGLARMREGGTNPGYFGAFLEGVLDKHDGRFHNRTYLALPLLEQMLADPADGIDATTMAQHLVADIIRHELAAGSDATPDDNENTDRPSPRTLRTRVRHALRLVTDADLPADITRAVDLLPAPPAGTAGEWFDLTVQPVSVLHDEYFFIRVLQAHEMVFTVLSEDVLAAAAALRAGSVVDALTHLDHATALFGRAVLLFRIVATMRTATFTEFREYTQGASAIQSAQYKRFELACGEPTAQRLRSGAFADVPVVGAVVDAMADGVDDLSRAYLDALCAGSFICADWDALDTRLAALEACHQRWKAAHVGLASRMLGDAAGSGYTAGVPYLQGCLDNRLFWQLGAR